MKAHDGFMEQSVQPATEIWWDASGPVLGGAVPRPTGWASLELHLPRRLMVAAASQRLEARHGARCSVRQTFAELQGLRIDNEAVGESVSRQPLDRTRHRYHVRTLDVVRRDAPPAWACTTTTSPTSSVDCASMRQVGRERTRQR